MRYDTVKNYAMKCRLYPTKTQKQAIDDALTAVRVFHNCLVYDMWNNGVNLIEKDKKNKDGTLSSEKVHFPDLKKALSAEYKKKLIEEHPIILKCPQTALTINVGLKADLLKEFGKQPIEYQKPRYYNEMHPRLSYSYQENLSKIKFEKTNEEKSPYVFRINLASVGSVKVRGWNQKLRFGDEETDFLKWCSENSQKRITVTVSQDKVGDYYIVFKIQECLKPFKEIKDREIGIDVGIKDIAICSDGKKYENHKYKKKEKRHQKLINRKLSRRWGSGNEVFREAAKKNRAEQKKYKEHPELYNGHPPEQLVPSKGYLKAKNQHAKLNRKITRKRDLWNHIISRQIVENYGFIGVESLNLSGMVRNKNLSYALTDAGFGTLLSYIRYKSEWHERTVQEINKWTPSSKRCSACGYIYQSTPENGMRPWGLNIRTWTCPVCNTKHDRDINAAKNILYFAREEYTLKSN